MTIVLDSLQRRTLEAFKNGKSIALIGCAGSGKSLLVQRMLEYASRHIGTYPIVTACAHTHQASKPIGGRTVSSVFGIHANWAISKEKLLDEVKKNKWKINDLRRIQVLIIEEVFLLNSETLEAIDAVLRCFVRNDFDCALPFGGRQVVLSGDIFQLGPVEQNGSMPCENRYAQLSRPWSLTFGGFGTGIVSVLSKNHRQQSDKEFFSILQRIGHGHCTDDDIKKINNTSLRKQTPFRTHTNLFLYRSQVLEYNERVLANVSGRLYQNPAQDIYVPRYSRNKASEAILMERLRNAAPDIVRVKIGAAVLLTRRSGPFTPGDRLVLSDIVLGPSEEIQFLKYTVGGSREEYILRKELFSVRDRDASILASRKQFPIIPAYAVTIHKCQGLTLQSVAVEFTSTRWKPNGMVYVALSRCVSLKGLWVKGLTKEHIQHSSDAEIYMNYIKKMQAHYPNRVISGEPAQVNSAVEDGWNNDQKFQICS
ncbi:AAA ATPase [Gracilaria domingensis]|nr:AAA ATPase [Gracilaria domingensis]